MDNGTGIGARVKRKEDHRFLTGKGNYTDDINLPKQTYAYFVRSPHAHATIKKIDTAAAKKMPGVVGIFTGEDVAATKLGGLICGWMIHSKDGSPMKAGPHPILALGKVTLCTQCAARRQIAEGQLIPGIRIAGSATFVEEVTTDGVQALVY